MTIDKSKERKQKSDGKVKEFTTGEIHRLSHPVSKRLTLRLEWFWKLHLSPIWIKKYPRPRPGDSQSMGPIKVTWHQNVQ